MADKEYVLGFQSTPPTRRATGFHHPQHGGRRISIHAPHTEGDRPDEPVPRRYAISIHAPHTEGDIADTLMECAKAAISIHAPHTEGDEWAGRSWRDWLISIHAPHTEGDERLIHGSAD